FKEAFQKGIRALEIDRAGWVLGSDLEDDRLENDDADTIRAAIARPTPERIFQVKRALLIGIGPAEIARLTGIDPWFVAQLAELVEAEQEYVPTHGRNGVSRKDQLLHMKRMGFSDKQLAILEG